jgi:hypothetical protein
MVLFNDLTVIVIRFNVEGPMFDVLYCLCQLQLSHGLSCQVNVTPIDAKDSSSYFNCFAFATRLRYAEMNTNDLYLFSCFIGFIIRDGVYIDYL